MYKKLFLLTHLSINCVASAADKSSAATSGGYTADQLPPQGLTEHGNDQPNFVHFGNLIRNPCSETFARVKEIFARKMDSKPNSDGEGTKEFIVH